MGATDVHPVLCDTLDYRRAGSVAFGGAFRITDDVRLARFFTVPARRRLFRVRADSRALQDIFLMSSTTRQVTRVL